MKYTQTLEETQQNQIDINNQFPVDSSVLERKIEFQKLEEFQTLEEIHQNQIDINNQFPVENSILEQKIELRKLEESLFIQDFERIEKLGIIFNPI